MATRKTASETGPQLEVLLRRLSDCPAEFVDAGQDETTADAMAIVCDHMRSMSPDAPPELSPTLAKIRGAAAGHLALLSIVSWLLHDDWFLQRPQLAGAMWKLLASPELARLSKLIKPGAFVLDSDRREELARVCLAALDLTPAGETAVQAQDRLAALDSAERERVLRATAAAERRAREVREAMAKAQALESASRYGE